MITLVRQWGDRFFPDLQILFRRSGGVSYFNFTGPQQVAAVVGTAGLIAVAAFFGLRHEPVSRIALTRGRAPVVAGRENSGLAQQLAAMRDALAEAESRAEAVGEQNDELNARVNAMQRRLASLGKAHGRAAALSNQNETLAAQLDSARRRLAVLAQADNRAATLSKKNDALAAQLQVTRKRLASLAQADSRATALSKQNASLVAQLKSAQQHLAALAQADDRAATLSKKNDALAEQLQAAQQRVAMLARAERNAEAVGKQNHKLDANLTEARQRLAMLEVAHQQTLADLHKRIGDLNARRARASADAQQRIAQLDSQRTGLLANRAQIEHKLMLAQKQLDSRTADMASLTKELERNRNRLRHSDSNQVALQTQIQMLEKDLAKANLGTDQFKSQLASIERKLGTLTAERDRLMAQLRQARNTSGRGTGRIAARKPDNSATVAALTKIGEGAGDTTGATLIAAGAGHRIEALLKSTGLDVKKLLSDIAASPKDEGGPFIPLGAADSAAQDARRHRLLQKLIETLPLRAPLNHYRVTSPFGPRLDPFNHRRAFHEGVDLAAPYRTHVYSTAPGTVIFASVEEGFGRLVKIDDGHGIVTMFAHLHRIYVVKGQHVPTHYPLGELGCTGRCDGPHVHYQIEVDGTPVNPAKFLGAGGNVIRVGAKQ